MYNEYMAIDNGGCLCTNSLCALIAGWMLSSVVKMVLD